MRTQLTGRGCRLANNALVEVAAVLQTTGTGVKIRAIGQAKIETNYWQIKVLFLGVIFSLTSQARTTHTHIHYVRVLYFTATAVADYCVQLVLYSSSSSATLR